MTPTVSIILPTFDRAPLLEGVIRDLIDQPLKSVEVLVMDDGSSDDTFARVKGIKDSRIAYWNLGKLGVPTQINEGILRSTAPYIMFLHDHDRFDPDLLTALADALDRNPSAAFAFCGYVFFDSSFEVEQERWLFDLPELVDGQWFFEHMLMPRINSPVLAVSMVRRSALLGELMDPVIGGCADVELWHRLACRGDVAYVKRPLIHVRGRDQSSQFSRAESTFNLMATSLKIKLQFIDLIPSVSRNRLRRKWKSQVDHGGIYVAWKALEEGNAAVLSQASQFVGNHGSRFGFALLGLLERIPSSASRAILRFARNIARSGKRSTL